MIGRENAAYDHDNDVLYSFATTRLRNILFSF